MGAVNSSPYDELVRLRSETIISTVRFMEGLRSTVFVRPQMIVIACESLSGEGLTEPCSSDDTVKMQRMGMSCLD